jgi:hypothetical protein
VHWATTQGRAGNVSEGRTIGRISPRRLLAGRLLICAAIFGAGAVFQHYYDLRWEQGAYSIGALLCALAATGWPPYLFRVIRNESWLRMIRNDATMRKIFAVLAVILLGLAYFTGI